MTTDLCFPPQIDLAALYRLAFFISWAWGYAVLVEAVRRSLFPLLLGLLPPFIRLLASFGVAVGCFGAAKAAAVPWPLLLALAWWVGSIRPSRIGAWLMGVRA